MSPNRLAGEASPYLRQHRDNPVDWYPWGDEAFAAARETDRPVLLSVGYSACHWCHVMAHESFEDPAVAAVMNRLFVNVKVDREERPDVDAVYMEAVQAMAGQGGWPMTVFLTPDGEPFFGGTYFPPRATHGRPGFGELMEAIDDAWRNRRPALLEQAGGLTAAIRERAGAASSDEPGGAIGPEILDGAYRSLRGMHDDTWGGFGSAPKFPQPTFGELLLRAHAHNASEETLSVVRRTLDAMAAGGIYDHLGGGFSRYSVDRTWTVPHFEKMLYDQAGLVRLFLHGWQVTAEPGYRQVVEESIGYVLRDLRHPGGGFYSAEDADSEGVEGRFYVWSVDEARSVLGTGPAADAAVEWYGATEGGNFEGTNILRRPPGASLLRSAEVESARAALFEARTARARPGLDDKVLTEWNAMFIAALAEAGAAMDRPDWIDAAVAGAEFLLSSLRVDGVWRRSWQAEAGARHLAYAGDHAWLVDAFTRLAEATGEARWFDEARAAAESLVDRFWDDEAGGVFTTAHDAERLIVRPKDTYDGAVPSANSAAAMALLRLGALAGDTALTARGEAILTSMGSLLGGHPAAVTHAVAAADLVVGGIDEVAITGDRPDLVSAVQQRYLPNAVLAWGDPWDSPLFTDRAPDLAFVCRHATCHAPVSTVEDLLAQLRH